MIVYVESNFILEIVLKQQHAASAEAVLQLAEMGKIDLASFRHRWQTSQYPAQAKPLDEQRKEDDSVCSKNQ